MLVKKNISLFPLIKGGFYRRVSFEVPVVYQFRDDFTTPEAASLITPRLSEPGPGSWDVADVDGRLSVSSGRLQIGGGGANNVRGYEESSRSRVAGLCMSMIANRLEGARVLEWGGDDTNTTRPLNSSWGFSGTTLRILSSGAGVNIQATFPINTDVQTFTILRDSGAFFVRQVGSDMVLEWVDDGDIQDPIFFGFSEGSQHANPAQFDQWRITQLLNPWDTDNGIATEVLEGARSAGDTFAHEADSGLEFTATTVPSAGQIEFEFRRQDSDNKMRVTIDSSGAIDLDKEVATVVTQLDTNVGPVGNGDRIFIKSHGSDIDVYVGKVLKLTTAGGVFTTDIAGELETEGTGGSVSDIISWPRVLSGDAKAALNAVANV